ncbi:hypothetical protein PO909_004572 [Leuciscus waleckii]
MEWCVISIIPALDAEHIRLPRNQTAQASGSLLVGKKPLGRLLREAGEHRNWQRNPEKDPFVSPMVMMNAPPQRTQDPHHGVSEPGHPHQPFHTMYRPQKNPADCMSSPAKPQLTDQELWWQLAIADSGNGKLPFPPQGELSLKRYAQVIEEKRFFLPEILVSRYFIAGLNSPPPLSEREELTRHPFRAMVDCLSQREPKGPTRSSSAMLPVVPEGRVLAVVTQGDQALSVSSPDVASTPTELRGKRGRRVSWYSPSESSSTESTLPEAALPAPVMVPAELLQPATSPAITSALQPRRKKRRRGASRPSSLAVPEPASASAVPEPASASAVPEPASASAVPEPASASAVPEPASASAVPEPASASAVPEPASASAVPEPASASAVPEPASASAVPEPASASAVPEPATASAVPSAVPEPATASAVPEPATTNAVPEPATASVVPESAAEGAIPGSAERVVADLEVLQAVSAQKEMPVILAARAVSDYLTALAKILEMPPRPKLLSSHKPSTSDSASPESSGFGLKDSRESDASSTNDSDVPSPVPSPVLSQAQPGVIGPEGPFRSVCPFKQGPVPQSPASSPALSPVSSHPVVPIKSPAKLPCVSPVTPVAVQPRTVFTKTVPRVSSSMPAHNPCPKPSPRKPKPTSPPIHPGQSPMNSVFPPPPLPFLHVPCLVSPWGASGSRSLRWGFCHDSAF